MENVKQKIINFRPIVLAAVFFAAGIACAFFACFSRGTVAIGIAVVFGVLSALVIFLFDDRKKMSICVLCFIAIFLLGFGYSYLKIYLAKNAPVKEGEVSATATVDSVSVLYDGAFLLSFRNVEIDGEHAADATAYVYGKDEPVAGERWRFDCNVRNSFTPEKVYSDVLCGKYYFFSDLENIEIVGDEATLSEKALRLAKAVIKSGMDDKSYGLAIALTLGDTSRIQDRVSVYRAAGIAHVFAVSGLHVGLFVSMFAFVAGKLKLKRLSRMLFILVPAAFYCFVCGFRPSSVRALIMATVVLLSSEIGFKRDFLSSIAIAFFAILCIEPFNLFDVGTQLSFLAVTGICSLAAVFKRGAKPIGKLADPLSVTLSATLGTLPVLVDMSGYMSIISVFANLIFVPILGIAYQFTMVCLLLGCVEYLFFGSAAFAMFLPSVTLNFISDAVAFFDFELFTVPLYFGFAAFFYYFGLFFVTDYLNIPPKKRAIVAVLAFALMLLVIIV